MPRSHRQRAVELKPRVIRKRRSRFVRQTASGRRRLRPQQRVDVLPVALTFRETDRHVKPRASGRVGQSALSEQHLRPVEHANGLAGQRKNKHQPTRATRSARGVSRPGQARRLRTAPVATLHTKCFGLERERGGHEQPTPVIGSRGIDPFAALGAELLSQRSRGRIARRLHGSNRLVEPPGVVELEQGDHVESSLRLVLLIRRARRRSRERHGDQNRQPELALHGPIGPHWRPSGRYLLPKYPWRARIVTFRMAGTVTLMACQPRGSTPVAVYRRT